jgi:hypothetical protein
MLTEEGSVTKARPSAPLVTVLAESPSTTTKAPALPPWSCRPVAGPENQVSSQASYVGALPIRVLVDGDGHAGSFVEWAGADDQAHPGHHPSRWLRRLPGQKASSSVRSRRCPRVLMPPRSGSRRHAESGSGKRGAQLGPQPADVDVDGALVSEELQTPHVGEDLPAAQGRGRRWRPGRPSARTRGR